jgi:hypothetical protein
VLVFERALTAAWTVEYVYPLPTDKHPDGGEVRLARLSRGAASAVESREANSIGIDHILDCKPGKSRRSLSWERLNRTRKPQRKNRLLYTFTRRRIYSFISLSITQTHIETRDLPTTTPNFAPVSVAGL